MKIAGVLTSKIKHKSTPVFPPLTVWPSFTVLAVFDLFVLQEPLLTEQTAPYNKIFWYS